jgi:hypothetical protein
VTRIPELEQELVAAAARLRSPRRRLVWPAARAALAVGAVTAAVLLALVVGADNDGDRRQHPAGAQPSAPNANGDSPPGAYVPERQRIARTANRWARLFAFSDLADCKYMSQPACERETCTRVGPKVIPNCTLPSPAFRLSFARAKVEEVEGKGDRAAARFSNGEVVELERVSTNELDELDSDWLITKWGRNAGRGFFE